MLDRHDLGHDVIPAPDVRGHGFSVRLRYDEPMLRRAVRTFVIRRAMKSWLGIAAAALSIAGLLLWLEGSADLQLGFVLASLLFLGAFVVAVWRSHIASTVGRFRALDPPEADMIATDGDVTFNSALGSATLPWTRFTEVWELDDCWMLFTAPTQFNVLPLAALNGDAEAFLRAALSAARWAPPKSRREATRLSQQQAGVIAGEAVDGAVGRWMGRAHLERRGDGLVWIVSSNTVGSGVRVIVDDANGKVLDIERWGVR